MVHLGQGRLPVGAALAVHGLREATDCSLQIAFLFLVAGLTLILGVLFGVGWPTTAGDTLEVASLKIQHQSHRRLRRTTLVVRITVHRRSILTVVSLVVVAVWRLKALFGRTFTFIHLVAHRFLWLSRTSYLVDEKVLSFKILPLF